MTQHTIRDLQTDYVGLARWLLEYGHFVRSRELLTLERTGVTLVLDRPYDGPLLPLDTGRGINTRLAAVESLQLISGLSRPDLVTRAAPSFTDVMVTPTDLNFGAYGPRVAPQLSHVVDLLTADPGTRRAVATIWREEDLTHNGDRPCTLTLQFLLRHDQLQLHVTMRSNDVWLGTPYDVFMFTQLQATIARVLDVAVGTYYHHAGSFHLYERNVAAVEQLRLPERFTFDLPTGVVARESSPWDVAGRLLNGTASSDEEADNLWYTEQLAKLRAAT